jgi:hypothetical protein
MCVGRREPRRGARRFELSGADIVIVLGDGPEELSTELDEGLDG